MCISLLPRYSHTLTVHTPSLFTHPYYYYIHTDRSIVLYDRPPTRFHRTTVEQRHQVITLTTQPRVYVCERVLVMCTCASDTHNNHVCLNLCSCFFVYLRLRVCFVVRVVGQCLLRRKEVFPFCEKIAPFSWSALPPGLKMRILGYCYKH